MLLSKSLHIVSTYMDKAEFVWALLKSRPSPAGRVSDSIKLVVDKITLRFPRIRSINRFRTRTPGVWFNRELSLLANPWKISVISLSNTCKNACKFIIKIIISQAVFRLKNLVFFLCRFLYLHSCAYWEPQFDHLGYMELRQQHRNRNAHFAHRKFSIHLSKNASLSSGGIVYEFNKTLFSALDFWFLNSLVYIGSYFLDYWYGTLLNPIRIGHIEYVDFEVQWLR